MSEEESWNFPRPAVKEWQVFEDAVAKIYQDWDVSVATLLGAAPPH